MIPTKDEIITQIRDNVIARSGSELSEEETKDKIIFTAANVIRSVMEENEIFAQQNRWSSSTKVVEYGAVTSMIGGMIMIIGSFLLPSDK